MKTPRIDSHQHFWKYDTQKHAWISDEMSILKKDYFPADLKPCLEAIEFDGCVAVQADQSEDETKFLIALSETDRFVRGVVGWVDFRAEDIEERLAYYKNYPVVKGFRHVVQDEPDDAFLLGDDFMRGIALLEKYGYTYDILILEKHLKVAEKFITAFPNQPFVIDHIAKPNIKEKSIDTWKADMQAIAKHKNVYCKLSGMVTEADWSNWNDDDLIPYIDATIETFGADRVMIGSDWPVCTLGGSYQRVMGVVMDRINLLSETDQEAILGGNAIKFYNL
ncbi:amidohydrolase family protein [Halosquirtibacter xylanolyticus]|uniref:amidohydrolase family protein n=1 Tax=Halosquirtibacter xylanolyticus TaxID=3374599 RepID=UPI00374A92A8|nr:amidohydrolase family protein [Prolixibacteraceae bacterium]